MKLIIPIPTIDMRQVLTHAGLTASPCVCGRGSYEQLTWYQVVLWSPIKPFLFGSIAIRRTSARTWAAATEARSPEASAQPNKNVGSFAAPLCVLCSQCLK
jgi:hypothetical protein